MFDSSRFRPGCLGNLLHGAAPGGTASGPWTGRFRFSLAIAGLILGAISFLPCPSRAAVPTGAEEMLQLRADGVEFGALFRTGLGEQRGAVLLLHGRQPAEQAEGVLAGVARSLADHGWSSLAIALPALDLTGPDTWLAASRHRVQAGLTALKERKPAKIALVGLNWGAWAALAEFAGTGSKDWQAVVLIDPPAPDWADKAAPTTEQITAMRAQVLEIRTRATDADEAAARDSRARMGTNPGYRQVLLTDPGKDWREWETFLGNRIHGWLVRAGAEKPGQPPTAENPAAKP